jgi:hypothetical protein
MVDTGVKLFFVSSLMIIHFGKNPVSGGRPPNDMSEVSSMRVITGILFQEWVKDNVLVLEL